MSKQQALELIDNHKNKLINPVEILHWAWLRVFILNIPDDKFDEYMSKTAKMLS